jgi:hypothetical protein
LLLTGKTALLVVVNRMATTSQKFLTGASSRFAGRGCATDVSLATQDWIPIQRPETGCGACHRLMVISVFLISGDGFGKYLASGFQDPHASSPLIRNVTACSLGAFSGSFTVSAASVCDQSNFPS